MRTIKNIILVKAIMILFAELLTNVTNLYLFVYMITGLPLFFLLFCVCKKNFIKPICADIEIIKNHLDNFQI